MRTTVRAMTDLPAHVKFPPNGDAWVVSDDSDVITSVQAFEDGPELVIEMGHSADEAVQIQFSAEGSNEDIPRFRKV